MRGTQFAPSTRRAMRNSRVAVRFTHLPEFVGRRRIDGEIDQQEISAVRLTYRAENMQMLFFVSIIINACTQSGKIVLNDIAN